MTSETVQLNVGGAYYLTRKTTLLNSSSFFHGALSAHRDCTELFVDRDPTHFRHILNWMRGVRCLPDDEATLRELHWEADYFCMSDMCDAIRKTPCFSLPRTLEGIREEMRQR